MLSSWTANTAIGTVARRSKDVQRGIPASVSREERFQELLSCLPGLVLLRLLQPCTPHCVWMSGKTLDAVQHSGSTQAQHWWKQACSQILPGARGTASLTKHRAGVALQLVGLLLGSCRRDRAGHPARSPLAMSCTTVGARVALCVRLLVSLRYLRSTVARLEDDP